MSRKPEEVTIYREGIFLDTGGEMSKELEYLSHLLKEQQDLTIIYVVGNPYMFMLSLNADEVLEHHSELSFCIDEDNALMPSSLRLKGDEGAIIDCLRVVDMCEMDVSDFKCDILAVSSGCEFYGPYQKEKLEQLLSKAPSSKAIQFKEV